MSDRPPLQVGYVLAQRAVLDDTQGLRYEHLCVVVQALWIPAMWAVLVAARLRRSTRSLAMAAAMISDVAILHGFFVWPKLIAAAFLLAALALVIAPEWPRWRRDLRVAALFGVLLKLSLLAHGSSVFGVIPLALFAAFRGVPAWRWLALVVLAGAVVYVPWAAYQHYADPPGNRLVKWWLGGDTEVDGKTRVLSDATDWRDDLDALGNGESSAALSGFRGTRFFSLLPFLGILLLAPFAMLFASAKGKHEEADWRFALHCFAFVGIACLVWGLLLFGTVPARATIHAGSLAVPLLAVCGCVAGLRSAYPRLALVIVVLNIAIVLVLYVPSLTPPPGTSYSAVAALLAALSLAGIGWALREAWSPRAGNPPG